MTRTAVETGSVGIGAADEPKGPTGDAEGAVVAALVKALQDIQKVTGMTPLDVISHQRGIAHRALEKYAIRQAEDRSEAALWKAHDQAPATPAGSE